jgi:hypothetical protein
MFDINALKDAKKKAAVHHEKQKEEYDDIYSSANQLFDDFEKNNDVNILKQAADKYGECLRLKSNLPGPYYNLACIFYIIGNPELAMDYLKEVQALDPRYPGLLQSMKMIINDGQNIG